MPAAHYPSLYQIHTRIWLAEMCRHSGRQPIFDIIADDVLDYIAEQGFEWVWFLGVWQTGPAGREVSLHHPAWRRHYEEILPDFMEGDVIGSPYAVQQYSVHAALGGNEALQRVRDRLRARGIRLLLDFVPNHTALDHPWVWERPEFYIHGTDEDLAREPQNYRRLATHGGLRVLAHGRDPYFPGWPDTLQLNYRHPALREAMTNELLKVSRLCDGVRCDMAMLMQPDVIRRTWGDKSRPVDGTPPVDAPFWPEAIARVRDLRPGFLFMAEVYWDLEWALQQQGFDYTYDKRFYDRIHARDASAIRGHLWADAEFQRKSVRFLENHDEPRAASAFPPAVHGAAAVLTYFVTGMRFFYEGQLEGRRMKANLHLGRRPEESVDPALQAFYQRLLQCLRRPEVRDGHWQLLPCLAAWEGNRTFERFIAYGWEGPGGERLLAAVNYGPTQSQCYVGLPFTDLRGRKFLLRDLLGPARYERDGNDLAARGLYLDLPEWGYHVFEMTAL